MRLCEIESVSQNERAMADSVGDLLREGLGLEVSEDGSGAETGSNAGNLLARIPGPEGSRTILLCAHLDTVPLDAPVEVEEVEGVLRNRNEAILGADNKAAVAVILGVARRLVEERAPPVGIEILFTTCEELALRGREGVRPVGAAVRVRLRVRPRVADRRDHHGRAHLLPHRGALPAARRRTRGCARRRATTRSRPRPPRSPPRASGGSTRRPPRTSGRIEGGTASNVVAERCYLQCEARSIDHERAGEVATSIVDAMTEAASDRECDLEIHVEELFRGYKVQRGALPVEVASRALADAGIEPQPISTGGGSDANVFQARGFQCVNLANGTEGRAPARRERDRGRARARCWTSRSGSSATARRERSRCDAARWSRSTAPGPPPS